jgi:hypothetical protein
MIKFAAGLFCGAAYASLWWAAVMFRSTDAVVPLGFVCVVGTVLVLIHFGCLVQAYWDDDRTCCATETTQETEGTTT